MCVTSNVLVMITLSRKKVDEDFTRYWNVVDRGDLKIKVVFVSNTRISLSWYGWFLYYRGKKRIFTHEWVTIFIFTSFIKLNIRSVVKFVNTRVSEKFLWAVLGWGERVENRVNSYILIKIEITFLRVDKFLKFDVENILNVLWDNREYYGFGDCESLDCLEEKIQMLHQRWRIIL